MKKYLVGGAVRDALMGLPVKDRDWVVVGGTPETLLRQGYIAVGRDFPVFLHPATREEYALARTERKTAPGYRGFVVHAAPDVSLEQDLARRDLTMNAIAQNAGTGELIDPFHGQQDIAGKVLRHVSESFTEDPVRILRLARFAARFSDFSVAPETLTLMHNMVNAGDADHLVAERVWQELAKGLMEACPSRMFEVLRACGALQRLLPELNTGIHVMMVLDTAAKMAASLEVRFACLTHDLGKCSAPADILPLLKTLCQRLRVPTHCCELATVVAREHGNIQRSASLNATEIVRLLERCDAFRKPARFAEIMQACECDARVRLGLYNQPYPQAARLLTALQHARSVDTAAIATEAQAAGRNGEIIGQKIQAARGVVVAQGLAAPLPQ